jgi:hypothetical protein
MTAREQELLIHELMRTTRFGAMNHDEARRVFERIAELGWALSKAETKR